MKSTRAKTSSVRALEEELAIFVVRHAADDRHRRVDAIGDYPREYLDRIFDALVRDDAAQHQHVESSVWMEYGPVVPEGRQVREHGRNDDDIRHVDVIRETARHIGRICHDGIEFRQLRELRERLLTVSGRDRLEFTQEGGIGDAMEIADLPARQREQPFEVRIENRITDEQQIVARHVVK